MMLIGQGWIREFSKAVCTGALILLLMTMRGAPDMVLINVMYFLTTSSCVQLQFHFFH